MKKILYLSLLISFISSSSFAQNIDPTFQWALHAGSMGTDNILDMTIDEDGNIIFTGSYQNMMSLGNFTITSNGQDDIFVAKIDPLGEVLWLKSYGGTALDAGYAVETDFLGDIVILGYMQESVNFDGSTLTSAGTYDICLFKLDSDGNIVWARRDGGIEQDQAYGLAIDDLANIYVTGFYAGSSVIGNNILNASGLLDAVIYKVSPSGGIDWVQNGGGTGIDLGQAIAVDEAGDVYVTGSFENSASFGNNILTSSGSSDVFIAKYSTNSTILWAKKAGGNELDRPFDLIFNDGEVVLTGVFSGDASFDFSDISSAGEQDIFLAKYSEIGIHRWAKSFGGVNDDRGRKLTYNENGDIYMTGLFEGFAAFDTDGVGAQLGQDIFIAKTDEDGGIYWVESAGGLGEDEGFGIAIDTLSDKLYLGMNFDQNIVLEDTSIIGYGSNDMVIAAYLDTFSNQIVIPPDTMVSVYNYINDDIQIYPNPATEYIKMTISYELQDMRVVLSDINGQVLQSIELASLNGELLLSLDEYISGNYIIAVVNSENRVVGYKRFTKQ